MLSETRTKVMTPRKQAVFALLSLFLPTALVAAPLLLDPTLGVSPAASGLLQPTAMAFVGANDMLVAEKATGRIQRVVNGVVQGTVVDLAVNSASEPCRTMQVNRSAATTTAA